MKKNKGLTLIEGLVVVAIIVVVLALCSLSLYGARKEGRDIKRVSDMEVLRSAMFSVKVQNGSYLASGCQAGAVYNCQGTALQQVLNTIPNFKDPQGGQLCSVDCSKSCEYSFTENMSEDSFEVLFYLEKGIGNYDEEGCYSLTEQGIEKK